MQEAYEAIRDDTLSIAAWIFPVRGLNLWQNIEKICSKMEVLVYLLPTEEEGSPVHYTDLRTLWRFKVIIGDDFRAHATYNRQLHPYTIKLNFWNIWGEFLNDSTSVYCAPQTSV